MKETISKSDWLRAEVCQPMAWHALRAQPTRRLSEADRFHMEQGRDIGLLAQKLYPEGILVSHSEHSAAEQTRELMAAAHNQTLFEATVRYGTFVARADIIRRERTGWHVMEVKSSFADTASTDALLSDLAYTVMVFQRAGVKVGRASLVLLSREFRFGELPEQLFEIIEVTDSLKEIVKAFDQEAGAIVKVLFAERQPDAKLVSGCRDCPFFASQCIGAGVPHTVLEIPGLHHKKLDRLSEQRIVDLSLVPDDFGLNSRQT